MSATALDYAELVETIKKEIYTALADPDAAINVSRMPGDRPQVIIISDRFEDMTQKERQDMFWPRLRECLGADATRISLLLARTWNEVR